MAQLPLKQPTSLREIALACLTYALMQAAQEDGRSHELSCIAESLTSPHSAACLKALVCVVAAYISRRSLTCSLVLLSLFYRRDLLAQASPLELCRHGVRLCERLCTSID